MRGQGVWWRDGAQARVRRPLSHGRQFRGAAKEQRPDLVLFQERRRLAAGEEAEGEDVFVDVDMHVMIDFSPPCVGEIIIYGILEFEDSGDRELCAWQIAVYGELRAGTYVTY